MNIHFVTYYGPHGRRLPSVEHPDGCNLDECPVLERLTAAIAAHEDGDQVDGIYRTVTTPSGEWLGGMVRVGQRP